MGELATDTEALLKACTLCPRRCGANRAEGKTGRCGETSEIRLARAARHDWEEPCISGDRGCGAIFFSGCALGCVFCQNREISANGRGKTVTVSRLREIIASLEKSGVHNINLVTASHFAPQVVKALSPAPKIPVVWNSSGYESVETLKMLEGKVQIYLPDLKYSDNALAEKYSGAPDYFETATKAILEMYRQTGPYVMDKNGILKSGVIIRHLILPNALENSFGVLEWVAEHFLEGEVLVSLMSQYTPNKSVSAFPELSRPLTEEEYCEVEQRLYELGIGDGYLQDLEAAEDSFVPEFNFEGI